MLYSHRILSDCEPYNLVFVFFHQIHNRLFTLDGLECIGFMKFCSLNLSQFFGA
jgi:hypothetical protein